jgi:hypothetical protein
MTGPAPKLSSTESGYADAVPAIRTIDMRLIDDLFRMDGGYVLDFTDRTFAAFFREEIAVNIDEPRYSVEGTSKAKRLRYFLRISDQKTAIRVLEALWEYREIDRRRQRAEETYPNAEAEFAALIVRLGGKPSKPPSEAIPQPQPKAELRIAHELRDKLLQVRGFEAQQRGYAFERFLRELFEANGLLPRASFRLVGEQIDGSFELSGDTYLLEAKWTGAPVGVGELHSFHGKLEEKADWTRGLFVSYSGFTEEGLVAFGRAKRLVCMDGLDLHDMLDRGLWFADVIGRKARHAAESGQPLSRVRDLFP